MWHFIKHFMTITRHRHKVMYHCLRCGILWQGMRHDLSKYSPTEFLPGARFYLGDRSPTEGERREYGYSKAWMHHMEETNITLNIGQTTIPKQDVWRRSKCR